MNIWNTTQIIFLILKLTGLINWSWLWVLSPFWIFVLLYCILVFAIKGARKL